MAIVRIIAGERKGLTLKAVSGLKTRPTTDKVKESLFNMIGPYFDGGSGLDLYGGSGSLAIEALSRGMGHVVIVDRDRKAIATIKANLQSCQYSEQAEVFCNDATRALKALIKRKLRFSYIFLDPPYARQKLAEEIRIIDENGLLTEDGKVVAEHSSTLKLPEAIASSFLWKQESYGDTTISIFTKGRGAVER